MRGPIVTIDGPAGAGKTTTAKHLAKRLGLRLLDTGATYRALALACLRAGADPTREEEVLRVLEDVKISQRWRGAEAFTFLGEEDVSEAIRTPEVDRASSQVAAHPRVRKRMVELQRKLGEGGRVVAEGRDAGTVIFPDAEVKLWLDASAEERARRRWRQYRERGINVSYDKILREINERDKRDRERFSGAMRVPEGAIVLKTDGLSLRAQLGKAENLAVKALNLGHQAVHWTAGWFLSWPFWYGVYGMRVINRDKVPRLACIITPNHFTMWDPPLVGAAARRQLFYLARHDLFRPAWGWFLKLWGAVPLVKGAAAKGAFQKALELLAKEKAVVVYPEGTRNKTSEPLLPFNLGPAMLAQLSGAPVIPVASTKTPAPWRPLRWMLRRPRLTFVFGDALWPQSFPPGRRGLVEMTKALREEMLKLLEVALGG